MIDIDALVLGGGQAELATAYPLRKAGREPVVLEAALALHIGPRA